MISTPETYKEITIKLGDLILKGNLRLAEPAKGLVLFVHGSGSSRLSARNNYVASFLKDQGFSSLLFDLLTVEEDLIYENRFDIELLTERLLNVTKWVRKHEEINKLPIGYFGSSTGAAAALRAAAKMSTTIKALVSRGGRPDLAMRVLHNVVTPTLLIVGGDDTAVIELNKMAKARISGACELKIIEGATHLFSEPGKLEIVAKHSRNWFDNYLK